MKKKLLSVVLAACCVSALFACGKEQNEFSAPQNERMESLRYTLSEDKTYYVVRKGNLQTNEKMVIPSTYNRLPVKSIGESAFEGCDGLTEIVIPDSVTFIGDLAFIGCSRLTKIIIPDSVTFIGADAFGWCENLTSVTFENASGWKAGTTSVSTTLLANGEKAAQLLKNTYRDYPWARFEE